MSELSEARLEILQKVADGKLSPEEADELLHQHEEDGNPIAGVKRRIRKIGRWIKEAGKGGRYTTVAEYHFHPSTNKAQYHYKAPAKYVRRIEAPMPHLAQGGPVEGEVNVVRRKQSDVSISIDYAVKADGEPAGKSFLKRMDPKAVLKDGVVSLAPPEIDPDGLPASIESAQMRYEIAAPEGIEFELSAEMRSGDE